MPIYQVNTLCNDEGAVVQERVPLDVAEGTPVIRTYAAQAMLNFQLPSGQPGQMPFQFDIPGDTPADAFANVEAALDKAKAGAEANLRKQLASAQRQIVLPNGQKLPPAGNPKTRVA